MHSVTLGSLHRLPRPEVWNRWDGHQLQEQLITTRLMLTHTVSLQPPKNGILADKWRRILGTGDELFGFWQGYFFHWNTNLKREVNRISSSVWFTSTKHGHNKETVQQRNFFHASALSSTVSTSAACRCIQWTSTLFKCLYMYCLLLLEPLKHCYMCSGNT